MVVLRPDHDVDERHAADDFLALRLGHASGYRDNEIAAGKGCLALEPADTAEFRIDLLGRLLPDVAGIKDDKVGVLGRCGLGIVFARQEIGHTIGIVDVHLAAEGFYVDFSQPGSCASGLAGLI